MRYGSLCSGIGGLDLAVETVFDASPAWFCEADQHAASVLRRWWPNVPVLPDLKTQDWTQVEPVELVCAGYPCQPFSMAGRRQGEADPRHLWPFVIDAVRVLRPRLVVLENVSGHLGLGFDAVLGDLAEAGFDAEWSLVRASDAGACHRRERLFVLAESSNGPDGGGLAWTKHLRAAADTRGERLGQHTGEPSTEEAWANEGHQPGGDGSRRPAPDAAHVRRERGRSPRGRRDGLEDNGAAPADTESGRGPREPFESDATRPLVCTGVGASGRAGAGGSPSRVRELGRGAGVAWGDYEPAIRRWELVIGRDAPDPLDDKGRLSVSFVEWMMGFDAGWADGLSRTAALRCLGNAVVPQQGVLALSALLSHLRAVA